MLAKTFGGLLTAAMLVAGAAHAAGMEQPEHGGNYVREKLHKEEKACIDLSSQLETAIQDKAKHVKSGDARTLLKLGRDECNNNREEQGVKNLRKALNELGVKPTA